MNPSQGDEKSKSKKEGEQMDLKNFTVAVYDMNAGEISKATSSVPSEVTSILKTRKSIIEHPVNRYGLANLAEVDATHRACIEIKKSMIMGSGWQFLQSGHKTKMLQLKEWIEAPNDNAFETFENILENILDDNEVFGDAYIEFVKLGNRINIYQVSARDIYAQAAIKNRQMTKEVKRWYQIHPQHEPVEYEVYKKGMSIKNGVHYLVQVSFRTYSAKTSFYGVPNYIAGLTAIIENVSIRKFGIAFFDNDARPAIALLITGGMWGDTQKKAIEEYCGRELKGKENAHKLLVLHIEDEKADIEIKEVSKILDGNFLKESEKNRDEIARVHGPIPPKLLGIASGSSIGGGGESIGELKTFIEVVIKWKQRKIEAFFNAFLRIIYNLNFNPMFKLNTIDITSAKDDAVVYSLLSKIVDSEGNAAMNVQEIRRERGMPAKSNPEDIPMPIKSGKDGANASGDTTTDTSQETKPGDILNLEPDKDK